MLLLYKSKTNFKAARGQQYRGWV